MNFLAVLLFVRFVCLDSDSSNPAGVCLTFDDHYISEWQQADSAFSPFGWKVTFFVSNYDHLDSIQRNILSGLQSAGHEIGFHGARHLSAVTYLQTHTLEEYLNTELSTLQEMRNNGLEISDFAYPSGSRSLQTDSALLKEFNSLRAVSNGLELNGAYPFYFTHSRLYYAVGMELHYPYYSDEWLLRLLKVAKQEGKILVLYGHRPVENANRKKHEVDYNTLRLICSFINENNMKFYRVDELPID